MHAGENRALRFSRVLPISLNKCSHEKITDPRQTFALSKIFVPALTNQKRAPALPIPARILVVYDLETKGTKTGSGIPALSLFTQNHKKKEAPVSL